MESLLSYAQESGSSGSNFSTIYFIIGAVGLWKMFTKAGEPGWIGIIPFYREYKLCEKVMGDPWYWLREFVVIIPVIGWIAALYFKYQIGKAIAKAYGKSEGWAWGYTLLDSVFYCITGFDNSEYYGVYGSGDRRTGEARGAKTVDFDVVKNEPEVKINQTDGNVVINEVREAESAASSVEFNFDQEESGE
jgi:hypothetical protein